MSITPALGSGSASQSLHRPGATLSKSYVTLAYREAERLLAEAGYRKERDCEALWCLELAKVHTALAQVAATAVKCDDREWIEVASRRFCTTESVVHRQ